MNKEHTHIAALNHLLAAAGIQADLLDLMPQADPAAVAAVLGRMLANEIACEALYSVADPYRNVKDALESGLLDNLPRAIQERILREAASESQRAGDRERYKAFLAKSSDPIARATLENYKEIEAEGECVSVAEQMACDSDPQNDLRRALGEFRFPVHA